jgi:N-acyl homoserine lactone hydrolase
VRGDDGTIVVAGQSHDTASAYAADVLAWQAGHQGNPSSVPPSPAWVERLQRLVPKRVVFAHDQAVWEP